MRVVRAEVIRRLLPAPGCGLSSSVMKNMRLVAVFGALHCNTRSQGLARTRGMTTIGMYYVPVADGPVAAGEHISHGYTFVRRRESFSNKIWVLSCSYCKPFRSAVQGKSFGIGGGPRTVYQLNQFLDFRRIHGVYRLENKVVFLNVSAWSCGLILSALWHD